MPRLQLTVGEQEKHTVEVDVSSWTAKVTVRIDGKVVTETYAIRGRTMPYELGEKEKHKVDVKISGTVGAKVEIFVDGVLKASS